MLNRNAISFTGGKETYIASGYRSGPYMHDFYDFQYCTCGGYTLYVNDAPYFIKAGMLSCVPPYVNVRKDFTEDTQTIFVGAKGEAVERFIEELGFSLRTAFDFHSPSEECVKTLMELVDALDVYSVFSTETDGKDSPMHYVSREYALPQVGALRQNGLFYVFLSELLHAHEHAAGGVRPRTVQQTYLDRAIKYMESNYHNSITIDDIATHVGLHRSYLYTLFKNELGISIRDFLIDIRIRAACRFLMERDTPIKNIAASVGYEPVQFTHIFKKKMGVSPKEYQESLR